MRIIKKNGQFQIDDRPMVLSRKAAKKFLDKLNSNTTDNPRHDQVLAECRALVDERVGRITFPTPGRR